MSNKHDIVFYDGECGLCHGLVRFILPRDRAGRFRFAPLQGKTLAGAVTAEQRAALPDSVVILTTSGDLLLRFDSVLYVLRQLGGFYRVLAGPLSLLPAELREWIYNFIARHRKKWFRKPQTVCPIVPEQLRARFLP